MQEVETIISGRERGRWIRRATNWLYVVSSSAVVGVLGVSGTDAYQAKGRVGQATSMIEQRLALGEYYDAMATVGIGFIGLMANLGIGYGLYKLRQQSSYQTLPRPTH